MLCCDGVENDVRSSFTKGYPGETPDFKFRLRFLRSVTNRTQASKTHVRS